MELAVVLAGIFLLYLLQVIGYRLFWDKGLSVLLSFQREPVREGEGVCLYEKLTNQKGLALPLLYVMFDLSRNGRACQKEEAGSGQEGQRRHKKIWFLREILSLHGREEKERTIEIKGLKRGLYRIPELRLTASNLFLTDRFSISLVSDRVPEGKSENRPVIENGSDKSRQTETGWAAGGILHCNSSLYVYPRSLPEQELRPLFQLLSDAYRTERYSYEDVFEIRGIREYQSFDPMKRINWKASARAGSLQVNQMEYVANQQVILVLVFGNLAEEVAALVKQVLEPGQAGASGRKETAEQKREYAISLAAGLAEYCLEQGILVGLLSNGEDFLTEMPLRIEACGGEAGQATLQQGLSRLCFPRKLTEIKQYMEEELRNAPKGNTYVILDASDTWQEQQERQEWKEDAVAGEGETLGVQLMELCREYSRNCFRWEVGN